MEKRIIKIQVLVLIAFFTIILGNSAVAGTWLQYDGGEMDKKTYPIFYGYWDPGGYWRNDPDVPGGWKPYGIGVRFTAPPSIPQTNLWEVKTIDVAIYRLPETLEYLSPAFKLKVTDAYHEDIWYATWFGSFPDGWYSADCTVDPGLPPEVPRPYIKAGEDFFIEYEGIRTNPDCGPGEWPPLIWCPPYDPNQYPGYCPCPKPYYGIYLDQTDTPSLRSLWLWVPGGAENFWEPISDGDLLLRVEVVPKYPESILDDLKGLIVNADDTFFNRYKAGQSVQQKEVLLKKIDEVVRIFEQGNYQGGYEKLVNDIGKKLADPRPTPKTSWLFLYAQGTPEQKSVTSFAKGCEIIIGFAKLAIPINPNER